jgi:hypothetical protein
MGYNPEPDNFFTKIYLRTSQRFYHIILFKSITMQSMPYIEKIFQETAEADTKYFVSASQFQNIFHNREKFLGSVGGLEGIARDTANANIDSYQTSIDASSIILAHSALDAAAFDYCKAIEMVAPLDVWEQFVKKKKIELTDLKGQTYEKVLKDKIKKYVNDLDYKSLLEKMDKIFQLCEPPSGFSPINNYGSSPN